VCGDFGKKERCDHFWMLCVEHDECIGSCEIGESRVFFFFFFFFHFNMHWVELYQSWCLGNMRETVASLFL